MRLDRWHAPPGDRIPNHPRFPVLIYHRIEAASDGAEAARALFAEHGWSGSWVDGILPFPPLPPPGDPVGGEGVGSWR